MYQVPIRDVVVETTPTINNSTNTTILVANVYRKYLFIQNNSGATIMISLSGNTLTGIAPTSTNKGIVLASGASYEASTLFIPTSKITAFQTSGGNINTVSVVEG